MPVIIKTGKSVLQKCIRKLERWSSGLRERGVLWNGCPRKYAAHNSFNAYGSDCAATKPVHNARKERQYEVNLAECISRAHSPFREDPGNGSLHTVSLAPRNTSLPFLPSLMRRGTSKATGRKGKN